MVFSEIYSQYFNVVAAILEEAANKPITEKRIYEIVNNEGFAESVFTIPSSLMERKWPLLDADGNSLLTKRPQMPLTILQKRWLKALLLDPRISLFLDGKKSALLDKLMDVPPLFTPEMFVYFDQYQDGDPYESPDYQEHFHMILTAIKEKRTIQIRYHSNKGKDRMVLCRILNIEYSVKDDKFRVIGKDSQHLLTTVNMATITECQYANEIKSTDSDRFVYKKRELVLLLNDERNALERAMLHFSHFEKVTERIDEFHYRFLIKYETEDETELLIRVLSFGPLIQVEGPEGVIKQIKNRLLMQKNYEFV